MIIPTYSSGDWFAVITDGAVALLPPTIGPARLTLVWEALREHSDLTHALTALAKGGLAGLPPFVLVSVADGCLRGFLRGNVRLLTSTAAGTQEHSAAHVATWAEINVSDVLSVNVSVPPDVVQGGRSVPLPVLAAVVYASSVEVRIADEPIVAAPPAEPVPVVEVTLRDQSYLDDSADPVDRVPQTLGAIAFAPSWMGAESVAVASTGTSTALGAVPPPAPTARVPYESAVRFAAEPQPLDRVVVPEIPVAGPAALDDDVCGSTVLSSSLVEIRRQMPNLAPGVTPGPFPVPPVPARVHRIRLSSGLIVPLDRVVLIGRAPAATQVSAYDLPRLVTVRSPNQDISRTHAQVHTDGEDVLVTDLNSTNGMLLSEPGQPPRRLRAGEPTPLSPEASIDLGDGVTFTLERDW